MPEIPRPARHLRDASAAFPKKKRLAPLRHLLSR
jgi:hypothetical protein